MKTTAADILIDTRHDWGVEIVFGLTGYGINGTMEALRKRADKIRFIQVRHEEAAAFMACAYAKYTIVVVRDLIRPDAQEHAIRDRI